VNNFQNPGTAWQHGDLTERIIGIALEVINELGAGFLESVYRKAMVLALKDAGLLAEPHVPITVCFRGRDVGAFEADILVDQRVLVELKANKGITGQDQAQTINYLKATGIEVGLLINFGRPRLEWRRLYNEGAN
jgi:GxxExxY protein